MDKINEFNKNNQNPLEIKIVFKVGEYDKKCNFSHFDLYINGQKEDCVKRFAIDISNDTKEDIDIAENFSYTLENMLICSIYMNRVNHHL